MLTSNRHLALFCCFALAGAAAFGATSCSSDAAEEPDDAPVRLQINYVPGAEAEAIAPLRDKSVFSLALPTTHSATRFDEVTRILVDITIVATNTPFYTNFELIKVNSNTWDGSVPLLPRNQELRFFARALNASAEIAFSGEALATLAAGGQNVVIPLASAQNNSTLPMPRMLSILYPQEVYAGQEEQFSFTIQGNAGTSIGVRITPVGSSTPAAEFSPASGTVTLGTSIANFMTVFAAPSVSANTPLDYQVTLTAAGALSNVSITTNFRVTVKPRPPGGPIVGDTHPSVLFNPVILSLNANGSGVNQDVTLTAAVSDDGAPGSLTYQWTFTPNDGTPTGAFANSGAGNPAVLQSYQSEHQGVITLAVTDGNSGTTTLNYTLNTHQFDDAIDNGSINGIKRIVSGDAHTCVLTGQNRVRCWGDNQYGQLGYGNTLDVGDAATRLPYLIGDVPLPELDPVQQLVAGANHTCALLQSGLLYCWGRNQAGQLGYNRTDNLGDGEAVTSFGFVTLGGLATRVAAGGAHTCAIRESGAAKCWGNNQYGQLGYGNTANVGDNEPVSAANNLAFGSGLTLRDLALGAYHTCAVFTSGAVKCWGRGAEGQLGQGTTSSFGDNEQLTTVPLVSLTGTVRKLATGAIHTCALTDAGTLRCWGYGGFGQIGQIFNHPNGNIGVGGGNWGDQPNELPSNLPSDINTGAAVTDVASNGHHVCALSSDGRLKCWGSGASGQLGYGNSLSQGAPLANGVDLNNTTAYRISAGASHTCALRSDGTTRCWGDGSDGRLGRGSTASVSSPAGSSNVQIFAP